jgi:hypothetical protein
VPSYTGTEPPMKPACRPFALMKPLLVILGVAALAGCGNGSHSAPATSQRVASSSSTSGATTASVATPVATPRCATSDLAVWIGLGEGGNAAGSTYYPLELTNISSHACHLFGFPGVSAFGGHQLGSPARRNHSTPAQTVELAAGETAHTVLQITDVGNFPRSACSPATAFGLKVIPPDETTSAGVPFNFRACSKAGPVFLSVQPVQPGVGIPGYPTLSPR